MKIVELRFKNLNSLYGEWFIDFSDPEFTSNGIFALTGPTGAGKSTILDAICLALYAATPRLGKITKSGNEIMSRQTGDCYAEVLFESLAGRFRCHWAQHRANKKAERPLQDSRHEISDAETGKPIETKKTLVSGVVEEKTGMDFERFTRSMLLAQGGFDTFLKADVEQKSKILEQITGTGIYSEISRRVHERLRDEREKLAILQAEMSGIVILEPGQEETMQKELADNQQKEARLATRVTETAKAIAWLTAIDDLKKDIVMLSNEAQKLKFEFETFAPDWKLLDQALKAAELEADFATLASVRKQQAADQSALKTEEGKLAGLKSSADQKEAALQLAEQFTREAKERLKNAAPLIRSVRSFDQKLADQKQSAVRVDKECKKDRGLIEADEKRKILEQEKQAASRAQLQLVQQYLQTHYRDEWLVSGLAGIEEQLGNLHSVQKEMTAQKAAQGKAMEQLKTASKELENTTTRCNTQKKKMEAALQHLEQKKNELAQLLGNSLLREFRTEKEALLREMTFLAKIAELEDHRSKLEDGKPCPLCGAEIHPFAQGNTPEPDDTEKKIASLTELIGRAEELEATIKRLEAADKAALKNLADAEKFEATAANEKRAAVKHLADLTEEIKKIDANFAGLKDSALAKLQPLGIGEIPKSDVSLLLTSLIKRLKAWQYHVNKKTQIEQTLSVYDGELKRLDAIIDTRTKALAEKQTALKTARKEYETGRAERHKLFGDKNPDTEETRLNKAVTDAERAEKNARKEQERARQRRHSASVNIASLKGRIGKRVAELEHLTLAFTSLLLRAGFADEQQFQKARLTAPERESLTARARALDDRQTDLLARRKDREIRLSVEINKKITGSTLDDLKAVLKQGEDNLQQLRDAIAGLKHRLSENIAAKARLQEKMAFIDVQKKESRRWDKLHGLIGSADGKKYRNFAQGLTFDLMVAHANRQLEKMTDRYLLIRHELQPLELNVIDNYQAGEIRSTKNLSGGESFIVSLTLALGLSKMASRKVSVDSLFLDEGFGTLDDDALETALETLAGLQQDGKLIGIISHVPALRERIGTQISIVPQSAGKSAVSGPGCSKVENHG